MYILRLLANIWWLGLILFGLCGIVMSFLMASAKRRQARTRGLYLITGAVIFGFWSQLPHIMPAEVVTLTIAVQEVAKVITAEKAIKDVKLGPLESVKVNLKDDLAGGSIPGGVTDKEGNTSVSNVKVGTAYQILLDKESYETEKDRYPIVILKEKGRREPVNMRKIELATPQPVTEAKFPPPPTPPPPPPIPPEGVSLHWRAASVAVLKTSYLQADSVLVDLLIKNGPGAARTIDLSRLSLVGLNKDNEVVLREVYSSEATNALKGTAEPTSLTLEPEKEKSVTVAFALRELGDLVPVQSFKLSASYSFPTSAIERFLKAEREAQASSPSVPFTFKK